MLYLLKAAAFASVAVVGARGGDCRQAPHLGLISLFLLYSFRQHAMSQLQMRSLHTKSINQPPRFGILGDSSRNVLLAMFWHHRPGGPGGSVVSQHLGVALADVWRQALPAG